MPATGKGPQSGGIIGRIDKGICNIKDTLSAGEIVGTDYVTQTGAIAGYLIAGTTLNLQDVYAVRGCITCTDNLLPSYNAEAVAVGYLEENATQTGVCGLPSDLKGKDGFRNTSLDFEQYWIAVEDKVPELAIFSKESALDISKEIRIGWYSDNLTEFTLTMPNELYGLAYLVNTDGKQFEGKTVKLGADITVNPNTWNAKADEVTAPEYSWTAIGTTRSFKGTFDGQGHTISGLYQVSEGSYVGLFGEVSVVSGGIKNVRLENSYFEMKKSSCILIGSIAAYSGADITNVYSDAQVVSYGYYAGGIVGGINGSQNPVISECWYDGKLVLKDAMGRFGGGIAGSLYSGTATVDNCLFTGEVTSNNTANSPQIGGLVGTAGNINNTQTVLKIQNSLSAGSVTPTGSKNSVGSVLGCVRNTSSVSYQNVYAMTECYDRVVDSQTTVPAGVVQIAKEKITGVDACTNTNLDFENFWTPVDGKTPELKNLSKNN